MAGAFSPQLLKRALCVAGTILLGVFATGNARLNIEQNLYSGSAFDGLDLNSMLGNAAAPNSAKAKLDAQSAALLHEPLSAAAINSVALLHEGKQRLAILKLVQRVTRRDGLSQLLLIQEAAAAGSIADALTHYDSLLVVAPNTRPILFPLLDNALSDPRIQRQISIYLESNKPWIGSFFDYIFVVGKQTEPAARALINADIRELAFDRRELDQHALQRLAADGNTATLRDYFLSIKGAPDHALTTLSVDESDVSAQYAPITWRFAQTADYVAEPTRTKVDGAYGMSVFVAPGAAGKVAEKMLFLPVGRYHIAGQIRSAEPSPGATTMLSFNCRSGPGSQPIWSSQNLLANGRGGSFSAELLVPNECPAVQVALTSTSGDSQKGLAFEVDHLQIARGSR
jgi:hypothetical protein